MAGKMRKFALWKVPNITYKKARTILEQFYRIGVWRFAIWYSYFKGLVITEISVSFYTDCLLGFGNPKKAVKIPIEIYHNTIHQLSKVICRLREWSQGLIPYCKQDEALIVFDRDGWCHCNNINEIFTEDSEGSFGFDCNNWLGSLDGFNILHRPNMVLDKYQDIIKKGIPKYISHTQFDMLDKALNYEYS